MNFKYVVNQVVNISNKDIVDKYAVQTFLDLAVVRRGVIKDDDELISSLIPKEDKTELLLKSEYDIYSFGGMRVCSNASKIYGAGVLADNDTLNKFKEEFGDFYILPSSIHEVIIFPALEVGDDFADFAREQVKEINATEVKEEDRLSDNVYFFDGELKIA